MSTDFILDAELREDKGKGASRRLRRANRVPGILYGGDQQPTQISLLHNKLILQLDNEAFYSHILTIKLNGSEEQVILRDLQRHPSKAEILHLDFQRVSQDKAVNVHVPLHYINEDKCVGVKLGGGSISKTITEVEVSCLPKDLPEYIEIDIENLELGDSIRLSEIKLPEGLSLVALSHGGEHDTAVVSVHKTRAAVEEDTDAEAEVTPESTETGESAEQE